jgi:hypothetical protein
MNAKDAQTELAKLLLKRLKTCALESAAFHAVFATFTDEGRSLARMHLETFRQSDALQKRVAEQFHDLDRLTEQVARGIQEEEFHRLLEQCDLGGPVN